PPSAFVTTSLRPPTPRFQRRITLAFGGKFRPTANGTKPGLPIFGVMSSTGWRTCVEADAVLFAELTSNELVTCAVLVIVTSGTNGVAVIVIVAVAPTARLPIAQVTV